MPLSEEELRMLEQMERALVEEDPKFASTLRGTSFRHGARRRALLAGLVFLVGIALLMTGAITQLWYVGLVGFVLMLGSATIGLTAVRGRGQQASPGTAEARASGHPAGLSLVQGGRKPRRRPRTPRASHSFMERLEERWRRRREGY